MSKEAIKNLLMDFMADYDPNKWSNDDVYEKYAEKIDNVRSMGEIIAFTELSKKVKDLEHRLSNCIEPKFKIGQEVWFVNPRNGYDAQIERGKIENLRIFALKSKIQINYRICDSNCSWYDRHSYRQKELFATEAEAKAKLEELKNE